jgi:hypothetical protein
LTLSPEALQEKNQNLPEKGDHSDDEDKLKGFVNATQYNPAPVCHYLSLSRM